MDCIFYLAGMDWIYWVAIGFAAGFFCGTALMALMAMSSRQTQRKRMGFEFLSPLDGPSTIF
jgi:cell division protein FtsW (lipid II flippase)